MPPQPVQLLRELEELDEELEQLTATNQDGLGFFRDRVNQLIADIVGPRDALAIKFNGLMWDSGAGPARRRLESFGQVPGYRSELDGERFTKAKAATREVLKTLKWKLDRDGAVAAATPAVLAATEARIIEALEQQVPMAVPCYRQAIADLADPERRSYRGTANELRATVWEVLDALAPDADVAAAPGFTLEKGQASPTQKQKARHILRSLLGDTAREAPERGLELIEERVAALTRGLYQRSSVSAHREAELGEVLQLKAYVDPVLVDLLGVRLG